MALNAGGLSARDPRELHRRGECLQVQFLLPASIFQRVSSLDGQQ